jgi:hypothetical protein
LYRQSSMITATAAAPVPIEEGFGCWRSLDSAPRDKLILVLVQESGGLVPAVGWRERSGFYVRPPYSGVKIQVRPRRWTVLPRFAS